MEYYLKLDEIEIIQNHYDKYFSKAGARADDFIMHEMVSDGMHIDVVHYFPTDDFPYHILATIGMSAYTMKGAPYQNIELIMFLPKDWKISKEYFNDESWFWPIRMLYTAARFPYLNNCILSIGHTFSLDKDNTPFAECTDMCSGLLTFPTWIDFGIFELKYGGIFSKKKVNFLCLTAVNEHELNQILSHGPQKFIEEILIKDGRDDLLVRNKR